MSEQNNVSKSLAHTKWNCKYHIVFAPKYRRKVFYEEKRSEIREIIRTLCQWKGVEIVEGEICPDHLHLLLSIPPKISVSGFMGYLKGKSSLMIFQKFGNMKIPANSRKTARKQLTNAVFFAKIFSVSVRKRHFYALYADFCGLFSCFFMRNPEKTASSSSLSLIA